MFEFAFLSSTGDWRADRKRLAAAKKEMDIMIADVPMMANYLYKKYNETVERLSPGINAGIVAEFHAARQTFENKSSLYFEAQRRAMGRFDLPRVEVEKAAIRSRIEQVSRSGGAYRQGDREADLWRIYNEGMAGDLNRQRATAEAFAEIGEMNLQGQTIRGDELRYSVGQYITKAKGDLTQMQYTDEMLSVADEVDASQKDLFEKWQQLTEVGQEMGVDFNWGGHDPVYMAFREAQFTPDGKVEALHDPGSVEVTGVDLSKL